MDDNDKVEKKTVFRGPPHTFGWLRRKDLDEAGNEAWEQPNGQLHMHNKDRGPLTLVRRRKRKL